MVSTSTNKLQDYAAKGTSTVLIVDDDAAILRALGRLLRSAGYAVRTFDRPACVLAEEIPLAPACLVIDVHLPEMDGVALLEKLRASGCRLPAIFITGRSDRATLDLLRRVDAAEVLYKPFDASLLLGALTRALNV
jgi:FixJ family two-component response regulator